MPTRKTYQSATLNGVALTNVIASSCTYSWKQNNGVPTATVYVKSSGPTPLYPALQLYDRTLNLALGAGLNIQRASGFFLRGYSYAMWPRAVGLVFQGRLIRAAEYQNHDDPAFIGGLTLLQLLGTPTGTDQAIVTAALTKAGPSGWFTPGNIHGTGATFGTRLGLAPVVWRSGTGSFPIVLAGAGVTALGFIQEWDKVSAVYTGLTAPVGFYRTFETSSGVRRSLVGGRPRSVVDLTFSEGIDIDERAKSNRDYPVASGAFVTGLDPGLGIGAVRNQAFDATAGNGVGGNIGTFLGDGWNGVLPSQRITKDYGSPFIEWGTEAEGGIGMNCERVGNALLADWNRETVTCHFRTPRDDLITPGMTILVRGPGGQPDRLGIGEPLWVDTVTTGVAEDGEFYQDIDATGGGTPDGYTPSP